MPLTSIPNGNLDRQGLSLATRRENLRQDVENQFLEKIRANMHDPALQSRLYQEMTVDMLTGVENTMNHYRPQIQQFEGTLLTETSTHPRAGVLKQIFEGLAQTPDMDVDTPQSHPFFTWEEVNHREQGEWHWSQLNLPLLASHREAVRDLAAAYPQHGGAWNTLDAALASIMEQAGPRYQVFEYRKRESEGRYSEQAAGHMAKMTGVLLAGGAAVLLGIFAIKAKKSLAAPLLYASVATLIASPQLRRMLFGGEGDASLETINAVLRNPAFLRTCKQYNVQGDVWGDIAFKAMDGDEEIQTFLNEVRNQGGSIRSVPRQTIDDFVQSMAGGDKDVAENLHRMIMEDRFEGFVSVLRGGKSDDEKQVIQDYIRLGSWTYAKDIDDAQGVIGGQRL